MKKTVVRFCYLVLCLVCILPACEKEEVAEPKVIAGVNTLGAEIPQNGSVLLRAELTGHQQVESCGFELGRNPELVGEKKTIRVSVPKQDGLFTAGEDQYLIRGQAYYFRAFIVTGGKTLYGEVKSFVSSGSMAPQLSSFSPMQGHLRDTIEIKGKYFGDQLARVSVFFDGKRAEVTSVSDSLITCIVPAALSTVKSRIGLQVDGKASNTSDVFELYAPRITAVSPKEATFRDILEISGDHFDLIDEGNRLWIGNTQASVIYSSRHKIKVVVPDVLESAQEPIRLESQLQRVESPEDFRLKAPEVLAHPLSGHTRDLISLEGKGFHPDYYRNKVFFGEAEARLVGGNNSQLQVEVPEGPYPDRTSAVRVEVLGVSGSSPQKFTVEDAWLMRSNNLPFRYHRGQGTFVIGGKAYILGSTPDYNDSRLYLWVFDPATFSWERKDVPIEVKWSGQLIANEQKAYLYTATAENSFYEYDPATDQWSEKSAFPGGRRDAPAGFSINGEIYVGMGADFEPYYSIPYQDFYKYSPQTDSWQQVADLAGRDGDHQYHARTEATTFVIDGFAYFMGGASHSGMFDCWKYDPSSNTWVQVADFVRHLKYNSAFSLNGRGYVANGSSLGGEAGNGCFEYDPLSNSWQQVENIGHQYIGGGFAFVVNGVAYVGGQVNLSTIMYELDVNRFREEK